MNVLILSGHWSFKNENRKLSLITQTPVVWFVVESEHDSEDLYLQT